MDRVFKFVSLSASIAALAFTFNAHAQTPQPVQTTCSPQFIEAYRRVVMNIKLIKVFQQMGSRPTNLAASVRSCNRLEKTFVNYSCKVGEQDAKPTDLSPQCTQIRTAADKLGIQVPADVPEPLKTDVTDDTAVVTFNLTGLKMTMKNSAEFVRAIKSSKSVYFIDGRVYDLPSSIMVNAAVRCTIDTPAKAEILIPSQDNVQLQSKFVEEDIKSENYVTSLSFLGVNWTVECSKHIYAASETQNGLSFGDLKSAFGANAEFTYEP